MVRIANRLPTWIAVVATIVLASGASAWADHGSGGSGEMSFRGTVVSVTLTPSTGTSSGGNGTPSSGGSSSDQGSGGASATGTPVGSLTLLSSQSGSVTVTLLSTTRFEVTGAVLATNFAGAVVKVRAVTVGSALDALRVEASNEQGGESAQIRGTVTAVGNGSITIQTDSQTSVTATLDPNVTVTVGDGAAGSLTDVVVGSRVRASWQVQNGQMDVTAIRVLGAPGGGSSSGGDG